MGARIASWIRAQPVVAFYLLAFAFSWLGWVPRAAHSHGLFPFDSPLFYVIGGSGPMLAVYLVFRVVHGREAIRLLFAPLLRWRIGPWWYVVALVCYPSIWIAAVALRGDLGPELEALGPLPALLPAFVMAVVTAIPEELAWRGYALPRLQARHSALAASLLVGALWALWHLPLLFTQGGTMATYPLIPYLISVAALAVVYAWIFNSTSGSVLVVVLFHAASNSVGPFVGVEQTAIVLLVAGVVVALFGGGRLSNRGAVVVHETAAIDFSRSSVNCRGNGFVGRSRTRRRPRT